jgi:hypothetical protein
MCLIISDLHLKEKEPFKKYQQQFLNWLLQKYNNEIFILLGDCFDNSTPTWDVYSMFKDFLLKRKNITYISKGNHCSSRIKGCALNGIHLMEDVKVFFEKEECDIDGYKCLFLPFIYDSMKEQYEKLEGNYDFIFTHITPEKAAFGEEGIKFNKNLIGTFFHGHIHMFNEKCYKDSYGNINYIQGVPISTRNGEDQEHIIIQIDHDKKIEFIKVPHYFSYETIEYPNLPESKNNIINVINAPSYASVIDKYKDYYIRQEGIELKIEEGMDQTVSFEQGNIKEKFVKFCIDNNIANDVKNCCLEYLI